MDFSWGSTELAIVLGSIKVKPASGSLSEISLLPNPLALDSIASVIQQQGRRRKRVEARLYVSDMSEYNDFVTDMDSGTIKNLSLIVSEISGDYLIDIVGEPEFIRYSIILFDVTWLEV